MLITLASYFPNLTKPDFWAGMAIGVEADRGSSDHSYYVRFPINTFSEINDQTHQLKNSSINTTSCDTQLFWNAAIVSQEVDHLSVESSLPVDSTGPARRQQWGTVLTESRRITKLSPTVHLLHSRNSARLWANVFLLFSTNLQNKFRSPDKGS